MVRTLLAVTICLHTLATTRRQTPHSKRRLVVGCADSLASESTVALFGAHGGFCAEASSFMLLTSALTRIAGRHWTAGRPANSHVMTTHAKQNCAMDHSTISA